jgi:hypothetical protein
MRDSSYHTMALALVAIATLQAYAWLSPREPDIVVPRSYSVGDTLAPVLLTNLAESRQQNDRARHNARSLQPGQCNVLVFYASTCEWSHKMAPDWAGMSHLERSSVRVPVTWIAASVSDTGATSFAGRYRLPGPVFQVRRREDRAELGIEITPTIYVVDRDGIVLQKSSPNPVDIIAFPAKCGEQK